MAYVPSCRQWQLLMAWLSSQTCHRQTWDMQTNSAWCPQPLMTCSGSLMPLLLWCEGVGLLISLDKTLHVMILYGKTYWLCTTGSSCCLGATGSCLTAASPGSGSKLVHDTCCVCHRGTSTPIIGKEHPRSHHGTVS